MSGRLLNPLRRGVAVVLLLLVPLPAALALAPVELDWAEAEATIDPMQIPELLGGGDCGDHWDAPDPVWPFGIPRGSEDPAAWRKDEPDQLARNTRRSPG